MGRRGARTDVDRITSIAARPRPTMGGRSARPQVLIGRELRHERGRIAFRHIKRPGEHAEILFSHRQSRTRALARHGATSAVGIRKDNMRWPAIKKALELNGHL
jgi:hypothetical protein